MYKFKVYKDTLLLGEFEDLSITITDVYPTIHFSLTRGYLDFQLFQKYFCTFTTPDVNLITSDTIFEIKFEASSIKDIYHSSQQDGIYTLCGSLARKVQFLSNSYENKFNVHSFVNIKDIPCLLLEGVAPRYAYKPHGADTKGPQE